MTINNHSVFPGRVIFDHLPKTAGTAVTHWLTQELGEGCVTPTVIGEHRDLIRQYGGLYSVISAHIHFSDYKGLDPRYQYLTLLREPVDRAVSQLYFLLNNHDDTKIPALRQAVRRFLESDGEDVSELLLHGGVFNDALNSGAANPYVEHFYSITGNGSASDDEKLATALANVQDYDCIGVYENLPQFITEVAALLGLSRPHNIAKVNATKQRPAIEQLSEPLKNRILQLNRLDIEFYNEILARKASGAHPQKQWQKYDAIYDGISQAQGSLSVTSPVDTLKSASLANMTIQIINNSYRTWPGENSLRPTLVSYHWLTPSGDVYDYDGIRTSIPESGVLPGVPLNVEIQVETPKLPGRYLLEISLLQECIAWFETIGFTPARLEVNVIS